MRSSIARLTLVSGLTLALNIPASAHAQIQPTPSTQNPPADNMALVRDKVRADKKLVVAEAMQMTEAEAKAFWPVYEAYQADLGKIGERSMGLVKYYAANHKAMSDTAATRILNDFVAIERDRVALLESYRPKFTAVLPALKVARYYQIENKVRAIVNYELAKGIPLM